MRYDNDWPIFMVLILQTLLIIFYSVATMQSLNDIRLEEQKLYKLYEEDRRERYIPPVKEQERVEVNQIEEKEEDLYSQEDIDLLARVVMSEASTQSNDCKQAIAAVVLNRVNSDKYPDTVSEAVYAPNQFSTANNGEPTAECYEAVYRAIRSPEAYPRDMYWFRNDHYHTYGKGLFNDGKIFFSTE